MPSLTAQRLRVALFAASLTLPFAAQAHAQQQPPIEGPVPTTAVISIEPKHDAQLDPASLTLLVDGHATPITALKPLGQAPAQIAILIDEGVRRSFSLQLADIEKSLYNWPAGTQMLIGYMQNGTVRSQGFTTRPEQAAQQLRLTFSVPGESASPYFCLSEFVKHWPSRSPGARIVLMLTNGVDPYNGSTSPLNQNSPYVEAAQDDAQRAGVAVYAIYFGDAGFRGARGSFSGQSYLSQVAEATGGRSFNNGTITPPSITPFLDEFRRAVDESYVVLFNTNAANTRRNDLLRLQVKTSQRDLKLHVPGGVHPGVNTLAGIPGVPE